MEIICYFIHEFPISKNSCWNNDFCHHLPFLMMCHTCKIWLGGCATMFPFWMKIHEWKLRLHHHISIFNQNLRLTLRSRHLTSYFGCIFLFHTIEGDKGHVMCFCHVLFFPIKAKACEQKCEQNVSNMQETCKFFQLPITQLWHPSPLLLWDGTIYI